MSEVIWTLREFIAHSKDVSAVALSRYKKQLLASGGKDCKINLWRLDNANCQMTMAGHDSVVKSLTFHSLCYKLCGGCSKGIVDIWDLQSATLTHSLRNHKKLVGALEFHTFGEFLASGSDDCTIKLWDLKRKGCIMTYKGHEHPVNFVKFSPDGRWLASADIGGVVKIWDMSTHQLLQQFKDHTNIITSLDFHPSELLMVTSSFDDTVKIWDLDQMKLLENIEVKQARIAMFGSNNDFLYCFGDKELLIYSWEPATFQTAVKLRCSQTSQAMFSEDLLVGAAYEQTRVNTFAINIGKISKKLNLGKSNMNKSRKTFIGPISEITSRQTEQNAVGSIMNNVEIKDQDFLEFISKDTRPQIDEDFCDKDLGILNELGNSHKSVLEYLMKKHLKLMEIKKEWISNGVKSAVTLAVNIKDDSIVVDLLHVLLSDVKLWNLDVCLILLPILSNLMQSNNEKYFHISLSVLRLIGHTFGSFIKTNYSFPPNENNVARQERFDKCRSCNMYLTQIHNFLRRKKTIITEGRLGEKICEMCDLIGTIVV